MVAREIKVVVAGAESVPLRTIPSLLKHGRTVRGEGDDFLYQSQVRGRSVLFRVLLTPMVPEFAAALRERAESGHAVVLAYSTRARDTLDLVQHLYTSLPRGCPVVLLAMPGGDGDDVDTEARALAEQWQARWNSDAEAAFTWLAREQSGAGKRGRSRGVCVAL